MLIPRGGGVYTWCTARRSHLSPDQVPNRSPTCRSKQTSAPKKPIVSCGNKEPRLYFVKLTAGNWCRNHVSYSDTDMSTMRSRANSTAAATSGAHISHARSVSSTRSRRNALCAPLSTWWTNGELRHASRGRVRFGARFCSMIGFWLDAFLTHRLVKSNTAAANGPKCIVQANKLTFPKFLSTWRTESPKKFLCVLHPDQATNALKPLCARSSRRLRKTNVAKVTQHSFLLSRFSMKHFP